MLISYFSMEGFSDGVLVCAGLVFDEKLDMKAYELLLSMKNMCQMRRPGVSFCHVFHFFLSQLTPEMKGIVLDRKKSSS